MTVQTRLAPLTAALLVTASLTLPAKAVHAGASGPDFVYSVSPCRILDTRLGAGLYAGALLPNVNLPLRSSNVAGTLVIQGGSPSACPDIPPDATGLFINIIAVEASGATNNDLGIRPWGSTATGTAINYTPGVFALNNGLFVSTCRGQFLRGFAPFPSECQLDIELLNGAGASAQVVIDVTGFTRNY